jgi:plasmid maintenance system antidote protein VapI
MDISTIRLSNLDYVIGHYFQGKKAHLAEAMGVSPNNISRYYSANASHRRAISDDAARSIEKAVGLNRGWMDVAHSPLDAETSSSAAQHAEGSDASRFEVIKTLTQELEGLTDSEVSEISAQLKLQLELIRRRHGGA